MSNERKQPTGLDLGELIGFAMSVALIVGVVWVAISGVHWAWEHSLFKRESDRASDVAPR